MPHKVLLAIILLELVGLPNVISIFEKPRFYDRFLTTEGDCKKFGKSSAVVARAYAYYSLKSREFLINVDENRKISVAKCAELFGNEDILKSLIYHVKSLDFRNEGLDLIGAINELSQSRENHSTVVELLPRFPMFLGPGGYSKNLAQGLNTSELVKNFVYAPEEVESMKSAYTQALFNHFQTVPIRKGVGMYIEVNGWHLKNMGQAAYMEHQTSSLLGFIVYVDEANSRRISTHDGTKNLPDSLALTIVDMKFSPEYTDSGQREGLHIYLMVGLGLYWFGLLAKIKCSVL